MDYFIQPGDENALLDLLKQTTHLNLAEKQKNILEHFKNKLSFEAIANRIQEVAGNL